MNCLKDRSAALAVTSWTQHEVPAHGLEEAAVENK